MKLLDQNTSTYYQVPTVVLMEQAAMVFVRELFSVSDKFKHILVVCGSGNNGADGIAIARLLNQQGIRAEVAWITNDPSGRRCSELFALQKRIYDTYAYPTTDLSAAKDDYDCIIDALFGIGLTRPVEGIYADAVDRMNAFHACRVAVDMASGVDADKGRLLGHVFCADHTITFSFGKVGQYLWPGCDYSGKVHVVPMGITAESLLEGHFHWHFLEETDLPAMLPVRKAHSNKGSYGKLLVIAGGSGMCGAAYFSAKAAYRMGTGLVRVMTAAENRSSLSMLLPEAVQVSAGTKEDLLLQLNWADALVIGPGLGTSPAAADRLHMTLSLIREARRDLPVIIDADGLNLIAQHPQWKNLYPDHCVITPHLGEMSRLTGESVRELQARGPEIAAGYAAECNVTVLLKDFRSLIASPDGFLALNLSGTNGMATAGSGDVLSGVLGALLAQKLPLPDAAVLGAFVHGLAGSHMVQRTGDAGLMASDLIDGLMEIL